MKQLRALAVTVMVAMFVVVGSANLWFISEDGWNRFADVQITSVSCNPCAVGEVITFSGVGTGDKYFDTYGPWLHYYDTDSNHSAGVIRSGDNWTSRDPAVFTAPGEYEILLYTIKGGKTHTTDPVTGDPIAPVPNYVVLDRITITVAGG